MTSCNASEGHFMTLFAMLGQNPTAVPHLALNKVIQVLKLDLNAFIKVRNQVEVLIAPFWVYTPILYEHCCSGFFKFSPKIISPPKMPIFSLKPIFLPKSY
jgi:hypothetical protein